MDRINPGYFRYLDRKIDYLNANGFVPFIEASRRDSGLCWHKYYAWPESYSRYIQYIWSRYQANITVLSPVHLDIIDETVSPADYTNAIKVVEDRYGPPPFGTLLSANANPSTLENWGENSWVTLHQIGNMREHNNYWYLTEIYALDPPRPALNGEPYYAGYKDARGPGSANYTRGAVGGPNATTNSAGPGSTGASFREDSRGMSTAPRASGAPTSSRRRRQRCGTRSSGARARRCSSCAPSHSQ